MKTEQKATNLSQFIFLPQGATNVVESHSIPSGAFEQALYQAVSERINAPIEDGGFGGNENMGLLSSDKRQFRGSNTFLSMLVDEMLAPSAGVAQLADLSDPRILKAIKDNHYTDAPALVLRGTGKGYERNLPIFGELAERVGDLSTPVLVTGLKVTPWAEDEKGYKLHVVPTEAFNAQADDRLSSKWNRYRFDKVDEKGLPLGLDKNTGSRTWYTSDAKLSGLYLYRSLYLGSDYGDLAYSYEYGRVAVVSRGAGALDMKGLLESQARNELLRHLGEAANYIEKLESQLGKK